jgi:hypothetical protein
VVLRLCRGALEGISAEGTEPFLGDVGGKPVYRFPEPPQVRVIDLDPVNPQTWEASCLLIHNSRRVFKIIFPKRGTLRPQAEVIQDRFRRAGRQLVQALAHRTGMGLGRVAKAAQPSHDRSDLDEGAVVRIELVARPRRGRGPRMPASVQRCKRRASSSTRKGGRAAARPCARAGARLPKGAGGRGKVARPRAFGAAAKARADPAWGRSTGS